MLIQHGDTEDGTSWLVDYGDQKPFHLQLVDAGFDVWLGNNRGTRFSRGHTTLDPVADAERYYDFTWAEMGLYDDSATVLKIKEVTHQDKISYVGYSQGTI